MEVMGWFRILRRRWRLTLLLVLLAVGAAAALATKPGPYVAQSQVVLLPSQHVSEPAGGNPYLSFGDSDTLTADLVRREVTAPNTAERLAAEGYTGSYTVVDDPSVVGPVLDVSVTGNSKAAVEHTIQGVTTAIGTTLAGMQTGLASADQITSRVVFIDPNAKLSLGKKARTVVVVLGIGVIFAIALPQAVDAAISRRRWRSLDAIQSPPSPTSRPSPASRPQEKRETEPVGSLRYVTKPKSSPSRPSVASHPEEKRETEPAASRRYLAEPEETMVLNRVPSSSAAAQEERGKASTETTRQPPDFDSGFR